MAENSERRVEIYQGETGEVVFGVDEKQETIWATQAQIADVFGVTPQNITVHLRKIYKDGELEENRTCKENLQVRNEGGRNVTRKTKMYNLDAIISVGYRVNSKKATKFRVWATGVLRSYVVDGAAINERRLKELDVDKLRGLEGTLGLVKRLMLNSELSSGEANGILEVISRYERSFRTLEEFDSGHITFSGRRRRVRRKLTEEQCLAMIEDLRRNVGGGELFGKPRAGAFSSALGAVFQVFNGEDLYGGVAEKAANLLYLVIKDHPFYDGNKRIGALLFVVFLTVNDFHLAEDGETKISDRALTALALLIAESRPEEKGLIVALICKLLEK